MIVKCTNPNCNNEQEYSDENKYCTMCGTILPRPTKKCISITCNEQLPLDANFCSKCGAKQDIPTDTEQSTNSSFHMGNDNIIGGNLNVVGKKEDYHIAGSATFVKNEDETKKIKKCEICGSLDAVTVGYECNSCGKYVCEDCFDKSNKQCKECSVKKDLTLKLSTKSFLPEEARYTLEDAYNNFMNQNETSYRFNETKKLLTKYPDNEKVIDAFLQMAEFVDYKSALNFIEEFNKKVKEGQEDLLCVHLSLIRLKAKIQQYDDMEVEIEKVKLKWPEYKNIKIYEAMYHILMSENLNDELSAEKLNKANELIQSLKFDEEDKVERSYVYYVKCLYNNVTTKEDCDWSDISEKYDLYPRIILNSLRKVIVSQNDVFDFISISEAIEKSPTDSHIWVCSGEYQENIVIDKKITLEGVNDDVFIISETDNPCISVKSSDVVYISNLKLKNIASDFAILVEESSCGILNCSINDNRAGIYLKNSPDIYISNCSFDNNTVSILLENSTAEIENTEVKNSTGPQITVRLGSSATIENSKIISGAKKGIIVDNSELVIKKSEISDNATLAVEARSNGKVILEGCSASNESYCWYHYDGVIECNNCTNFIIEDENSDKEFNREIELSSTCTNQNVEAAEIEFEKGWEILNEDSENIDYAKAFECFQNAISLNENHAKSYFLLGCLYTDGAGVDQNLENAFRCYEIAANLEPDNADFLSSLGECYYYGHGCSENNEKAFSLFEKTVEIDNENVSALYYLAECYYAGFGCIQDGLKAFKLLKKVVMLNPDHYNAHFLLGRTYYSGDDINEDYRLAYNHLKKAADNDHVRAKYYLGLLIIDGKGCSQDTTRGMKLIRTAANNGCEEAKEFLNNPDNLPATTNNSSKKNKDSDSSGDIIAGAAIGAGAVLLGAAALKCLFGDDKKK